MKASDFVGFGLSLAFGLWLVLFPESVIKYYTWFHRGYFKSPGPSGVRLAGVLWSILVVVVGLTFFRRRMT
jgi:hypothetical protein